MIRIMIVDDQSLIRDGLAMLLNLRSELEVVGTANDGDEVVRKAEQLQPEIILMDIRMPRINGVEGTRLIREKFPDMKVLMLTTFNDSELIFEALEQGASGYLLKDMETDAIVQAIFDSAWRRGRSSAGYNSSNCEGTKKNKSGGNIRKKSAKANGATNRA